MLEVLIIFTEMLLVNYNLNCTVFHMCAYEASSEVEFVLFPMTHLALFRPITQGLTRISRRQTVNSPVHVNAQNMFTENTKSDEFYQLN